MKAHPFILSAGMVVAVTAGLQAAQPIPDSAPVSYSNQSSSEVEDIGAVGEGPGRDASKDGKDSKSAPPPPPSKWSFNFDARANFTTNARLSGNHASNDFIFFPNLGAEYKTPLGHGFAFDSLTRIESGIYADHTERAFVGYSQTDTIEYRLKPNLPRIFIGVEPYRYDGFDGQGRITEAIGTSVGTDYGYGFNNGNSLLFVGYSYTDYFSDPEMDNRLTHTATVGFSQVIRPKLIMQAYYQYVHDLYPDTGRRQDSRNELGINFTYQQTKNLFWTLSGTFVDNDSNQLRASYQSAGLSLGLNYQY
jgi:hypothetical protein